ncbi:MAG TPA: CHAT domain-containing protein [Chloroflexia bacterium]|nr:CHAT domain-containing protein [Chloroflexia bacterium]
MAIKEYCNFYIVGNKVETDDLGNVTKLEITVSTPFYGDGEKELVRVTEPASLAHQIRQLQQRDLQPAGVIQLGTRLANLLLPPGARSLLLRNLDKLKPEQGLRLRLQLDNTLSDFPWEYINIQHGAGEGDSTGFLALDGKISITRYARLDVSSAVDTTPRKRFMLVVMDNPTGEGFDHLKLSDEALDIRAILKDAGGIAPTILEDATIEEFTSALYSKSYDVLHFSGHGAFIGTRSDTHFGATEGSGQVALVQHNGEAADMTASAIATTVKHTGPQLAVLSACETGTRDEVHTWSGTVMALMRAEIPVAIGMQYTIWDGAATTFATTFYRALEEGLSVDLAVQHGRQQIFNQVDSARLNGSNGDNSKELAGLWRDWGVPVLYFRADHDVALPPRPPLWKRPLARAVAALVLVALVVSGAYAATYKEPPPIFKGQIVFSQQYGGHWGLYRLNAGSDLTSTTASPLLVNSIYKYANASFSPDGTMIAYVSNQNESGPCLTVPTESEAHCNREIYVMNADGSCPRALTNDPRDSADYDDAPVWSPDGHTILFVSTRNNPGTPRFNIFTVPLEGGLIRPLNVDDPKQNGGNKVFPRYVTWGPTGIIGTALTSHWGLWWLGASSSEARSLFSGAIPIDMPLENDVPQASGSDYLLFQAYSYRKGGTLDGPRSLWQAKVSDSFYSDVRLVVGKPGDNFDITWPVWSPDNNQIALANKRNGQVNLWIVNPFDDNPAASAVQITNSPELKGYVAWGKQLPPGWQAPACTIPAAQATP